MHHSYSRSSSEFTCLWWFPSCLQLLCSHTHVHVCGFAGTDSPTNEGMSTHTGKACLCVLVVFRVHWRESPEDAQSASDSGRGRSAQDVVVRNTSSPQARHQTRQKSPQQVVPVSLLKLTDNVPLFDWWNDESKLSDVIEDTLNWNYQIWIGSLELLLSYCVKKGRASGQRHNRATWCPRPRAVHGTEA